MSTDLTQNYNQLSQPQRKKLREQYVIAQDKKCAHCGRSLLLSPSEEVRNKKIDWSLFPPYFTKHPIHLHHCHKTGNTIGAVHALCNAVLWQYHGE